MPRRFEEEEEEPRDEGPGIVGRLFQRGVSAPNVAMKILAEQMGSWKKDFLGIFQAEIRHFLDRQNAGEEIRKLIDGKRLEVSVRLVPDDSPRAAASAKEKKPAPVPKATAGFPKKPPRAKKR